MSFITSDSLWDSMGGVKHPWDVQCRPKALIVTVCIEDFEVQAILKESLGHLYLLDLPYALIVIVICSPVAFVFKTHK